LPAFAGAFSDPAPSAPFLQRLREAGLGGQRLESARTTWLKIGCDNVARA
jgi:hypothetical protein